METSPRDLDLMPSMEAEDDWGTRLLFRARLERIDDLARKLLDSWGFQFEDLEQVDLGRPITLDALFGSTSMGWADEHFGKLARQISSFVYLLFIASDTHGSGGFGPKDPRVADIWKPVMGGSETTIYLALGEGDTVLISCPEIDPILLGKVPGDFRTSLTALRSLGAEIVDRINLLVPPATVLRARKDLGSGEA